MFHFRWTTSYICIIACSQLWACPLAYCPAAPTLTNSSPSGVEGLDGSVVFAPDLSLDGNALGIDGAVEYRLVGAATAEK